MLRFYEVGAMKKPTRPVWTLALCIALFPPLWAVLAPYIGVRTGAVALICAGVYNACSEQKRAVRMSLGFLAGDAWAVLALWIMEKLPWNENVELFLTLFVLGGVAVLIASLLKKVFYLPAWLSGWAIGLTVMAPMGFSAIGTYPLEIAAAMLVGVWYVGVFIDAIHSLLNRKKSADEEKDR